MGKSSRFFAEAGALGVGGVIFACILWAVAAIEHYRDKNVPAFWFLLGGCGAFCFGAFMAWSKADDRANEHRPQIGFRADLRGFYLAHLAGDPVRFIEISPLIKRTGTIVRFEQVDFLEPNKQITLVPHLEIAGLKKGSDMGAIVNVLCSWVSREVIDYPVTIQFRWGNEHLEENVVLRWIGTEKRFITARPSD